MNEKISTDESISRITTDTKEIIRIIADNMLKTRPRREVYFRPYIKQEAVRPLSNLRVVEVDIYQLYPGAKENDAVFAGTYLTADYKQDIAIRIIGNVRVFLRGEEIYSNIDGDERAVNHVEATLYEGYNELLFECVCKNGKFGFSFVPSMPFYRGMWAKDYLFLTRTTLPLDEFEGEEGIAVSRLYINANENENALLKAKEHFISDGKKYCIPAASKETNEICFDKLYGEKSGSCAYALSYCKNKGEISICNQSPVTVFVNGKAVKEADENKNTKIRLEKGDCILIKSMKNGEKWGFAFEENGVLDLPFVKTKRKHPDKWLLIGSFGGETDALLKFGPEYMIEFKRPYINADGERCYWRFAEADTYLRPYLDSTFFGQWYYALMVGHYGLRAAAETLGEARYMDYFTDSIEQMAEYFDYICYDRKMFGDSSFMQRAPGLGDWDNIGTMGMNMSDAYFRTGNPELLSVIERLIMGAEQNISRFPDGTFNRVHTMWADDLFMSCPFLVRLGGVLGEKKYYEECVRQITGFKNKLFMEDKKIFSHIYFVDDKKANRVPWGRGNGWVAVAITEVLMHLPESFEERTEIIKIFSEFAEGILKHQDKSGMWHQVLDREESYLETSATAMFTLALARGVLNGWLGKEYAGVIRKSWDALCKTSIDKDGNVYGVCKGSGCNMEAEYYFTLDTVKNDDHGTGIILAAACELAKLGI